MTMTPSKEAMAAAEQAVSEIGFGWSENAIDDLTDDQRQARDELAAIIDSHFAAREAARVAAVEALKKIASVETRPQDKASWPGRALFEIRDVANKALSLNAPFGGEKQTEWKCEYCGAVYAEYINGCPKCWLGEPGTASSVRLVRKEVGNSEMVRDDMTKQQQDGQVDTDRKQAGDYQ